MVPAISGLDGSSFFRYSGLRDVRFTTFRGSTGIVFTW